MSVFPGSPYAPATSPDPSFDTAGYLRSLRLGISILQIGLLLNIAMILIVLGIALLPMTGVRLDGELGDAIGYGVLGLALVYVLLNCIGAHLYAARDRRLPPPESAVVVRTLLRACTITTLIGSVVLIALMLQGVNVEPSLIVQGSNPLQLHFNPVAFALTIPLGLAAYVGAVSMMVYTRWMARRVADDQLERTCTWTLVLVGIVYLFTSVVQIFGPASLHWSLMQLRLDPMIVLGIGILMTALPLVAILAMYNVLTALKRVLSRLA